VFSQTSLIQVRTASQQMRHASQLQVNDSYTNFINCTLRPQTLSSGHRPPVTVSVGNRSTPSEPALYARRASEYETRTRDQTVSATGVPNDRELSFFQAALGFNNLQPRLHDYAAAVKRDFRLGYITPQPATLPPQTTVPNLLFFDRWKPPFEKGTAALSAIDQPLTSSCCAHKTPRADYIPSLRATNIRPYQLCKRGEPIMEVSRNILNCSDRRDLQTTIINSSVGPVPIAGLESLTWEAAAPLVVPLPVQPANPRCREKGCVFPAARAGRCLQHDRQSREPIIFSSHQPTRVVLDQGKFGVPETEVDTSRVKDRRRLAALRETFLED
jgi:hypothetical protein